MADPELQNLLQTLAERDIPLGEDDVAWAFDGARTRDSAATWVREYLHPSSLLTKDEVNFLEKGGKEIANANSGRPLSDTELEAAIDSLEASTAAIERQCELLESQKKALREIQARNASQGMENSAETRQKKLARKRAQVDLETDELSQSTTGRLRNLSKQSDVATSGIPLSVERVLEKDDRLLDGLQKILPKFSQDSQSGDDATDVEQLCSALTTLSAKEIRARLDKVYQEALSYYSRHQNGSIGKDLSDEKQKQRQTLRTELEELGGEIDGLVAIAVDHQYRKPLKQGMLSAQADSHVQKAKWSEYTVSALIYLTSRLDVVGDHIHHLHTHSAALQAISDTLDDTLAAPSPKGDAPQRQSSPIVDRSGAKGLKPLRLVQANLSEGQDPTIPFLRQHEVRVAETDGIGKVADMLNSAVRDQGGRLSSLSRSTDDTISEALSKSLANTDAMLGELLRAVYAHSNHGSVHLVQETARTGLNNLEHETQRLGEAMRELDVDGVAQAVRTKQRRIVDTLTTQG